jgi:hypothetical protein
MIYVKFSDLSKQTTLNCSKLKDLLKDEYEIKYIIGKPNDKIIVPDYMLATFESINQTFEIKSKSYNIDGYLIFTKLTDKQFIIPEFRRPQSAGSKYNSNKKITNKIKKNKKTIKNHLAVGGGGNAPMDLQGLTQADVEALMQQGIMPEQIAQLAQEQGQPVPPIILEMLSQAPGAMPPDAMGMPPDAMGMPPGAMDMGMPGAPPPPDKTSKFPAMMDLPTYAQYKNVEKAEQQRKLKFGAHKPTVFGYVFSDLISEDILRDMKRTQGGFLIGVNLNNLFNTFREAIKMDEKGSPVGKMRNPEEIFKRVGEYVNVDFDKILETKMGYRGSDIPMLPEQELNEYSSFGEVINESKKYVDSAFKGIITPLGLLIMTRMLYKYRKNNAQWVRVATVLELIHRYLGGTKSRVEFFKERDEIPIQSLIELEEFYNTDHIFMTEDEIHKFKRDLDFYKYDPKINIRKQIQELLSKAPPII